MSLFNAFAPGIQASELNLSPEAEAALADISPEQAEAVQEELMSADIVADLETSPENPGDRREANKQAMAKAQAWVDKVKSEFPVHPFERRWHLIVFDQDTFASFELEADENNPGAAYIAWFQAYPTGQGVGARAMQKLTEMADASGITLTLETWDKGKVSKTKLARFYKGHGFKKDPPKDKFSKAMTRQPQAPKKVEASSYDGPSVAPALPVSIGPYTEGETAYVPTSKKRRASTTGGPALWSPDLSDDNELALKEPGNLEKAPNSIADDGGHGTRRDG